MLQNDNTWIAVVDYLFSEMTVKKKITGSKKK